jgi:Fe-S-cluster containining protein
MTSEAVQPQVKLITITIETPDGTLPPARVGIPDIPMRMANLIPPMQQLCNGIVELAIRREINLGATISCHKGCGVCCSQLVPLSSPEVFFLLDFVYALPSERRNEIEARFRAVKEAMEAKGLVERLRKIEDTQEHQMLAWDYFRMGMPCPFLEENACSIHPHRPFACREYNVISPPERCTDPFNKGIKKIQIPKNMTTATARLAAKLFELPAMLIPMTSALEWATEHETYNRRTWPGVWLFNRMMEYATGADLESLNPEMNK